MKNLFHFTLALIIAMIIGLFLPPTPRASTSHLFSKIDKDLLLRNAPSPRMILVGGSNLSMSLNSQQLLDSLKYNPVNTGLSASLGLLYMLDHTLPFVRTGDIVIISPEYSQFYEKLSIGTEDLPRVLLDTSPVEMFKLRWPQFANSLKYFPRYCLSKYKLTEYFNKAKSDGQQVYLRNSFNQFGDMNKHWDLKKREFNPLPVAAPNSFDPEVLSYLVNFRKLVEQRGARLYITFPALDENSFSNEEKEITFIDQQLKSEHFILLGNPIRYRMADSLMFDTPYHLTRKGVNIRTQMLIEDLRVELNRQRKYSNDLLTQNPITLCK
ncbi:MAG TPA: hypothetical protein VL443_14230 [Cyclobacteriaceae bacterium]|nr:hypothetical protein [Cyclobacteriaceae bacterium]